MARYLGDQNKLVMIHESGTYGNSSGNGHWIGQVQSHTVDDADNRIITRYLGTSTRNIDSFEDGPRDVTGNISYYPQNFGIVLHALGSVTLGSATNAYTITATEIDTDVRQSAFTSGALNPPYSFTLEDSKTATGTGKNFVRTINGVVANTVTINASQNEPVSVEYDYVAQTISNPPTSGTTTSVTAGSNRSYLWSDVLITVDGTVLNTAKTASLEINQNIQPPHYLNGSRDISVPFPQNRDYTFNVTLDWDSENKSLYEKLFKGGSSFNAAFDLNADITAIGSQHTVFIMSGCEVVTLSIPTELEGISEASVEIRPKSVSAVEYSSTLRATANPF